MILDTADSREELDEKECYWINYYDTYNSGGYNMSVGGQKNKKEFNDSDDLSKMHSGREFLVYDMDCNFIKSTFSQTAFAEEIGVCVQTVNNVLLDIKNTTGGFMLFYKDGFTEEILKEKIIKIGIWYKDFAVFGENDEFIGTWNNKLQCSKDLNVSNRTIQKQLTTLKGIDISIRYPNIYRYYYLENVPTVLTNKMKEGV